MTLSVVLIARDEAPRIEACLVSVAWADELVVVVDDRTVDNTTELAQRHTDRVFTRTFESFAAQRQWAQAQASGDWVLWMDCDEIVPEALAAEIRSTLDHPTCNGYRVPRLDYMFGRWICHGGWYPQHHLRLYRRNGASWRRDVHERVDVPGPIGALQNPILHFSHARVRDWVEQMSRYTSMEARDMYEQGIRLHPLRIVFEPPLFAGYKYFVQSGWRDGGHGLALALLLGCYRLIRNLELWDLQQSGKGPRERRDCPPSISRS